jgi:predicted O-methyltransferase YrrM
MSVFKSFVSKFPRLYRALALFPRYRFAKSYYTPKLRLIRKWLFRSREVNNFTYDLQPINLEYLAAFLAEVTGTGCNRILDFIAEIQADETIKSHVRRMVTENPRYRMKADEEAKFCRRVGWYAIVRATRPKVIVETGIDKGLGALVLTAALMRNKQEGAEGRYYGTDINPEAGYLFREPYCGFGKILYGDSCESLRRLDETVDLFINDSDHSAEYERKEYEAIAPKLAERSILLGDNAHLTDELFQFARRTDRRFLFFQEWPQDHWYPGCGIGAAFRR